MYDNMDHHGSLSSSPDSSPDAFDELHPHPCTSFPLLLTTMLISKTVSGRYFSFPSFDLYEANQQDDEKSETKSP
jgi:hypothetical protein